MLKNPLSDGQEGVQCAMFIDEIAPYIPPVKVPACKENLELLFRQGRKYGVSCLIATQSPGDIDYKAIGQFSTFILGTLNTKQDIEKVKKRLESVAPKEIDYIVNSYTNGKIQDDTMTSWLKSVYINGMNFNETIVIIISLRSIYKCIEERLYSLFFVLLYF